MKITATSLSAPEMNQSQEHQELVKIMLPLNANALVKLITYVERTFKKLGYTDVGVSTKSPGNVVTFIGIPPGTFT